MLLLFIFLQLSPVWKCISLVTVFLMHWLFSFAAFFIVFNEYILCPIRRCTAETVVIVLLRHLKVIWWRRCSFSMCGHLISRRRLFIFLSERDLRSHSPLLHVVRLSNHRVRLFFDSVGARLAIIRADWGFCHSSNGSSACFILVKNWMLNL